jgi:integrase
MLDAIELRCPTFKTEEEAKAYDRRAIRKLDGYRGIRRIGFMQYRLQYRPKGFPCFDKVFRDIDQAIEVHASLKAMYKSGTLEASSYKKETFGSLLRKYADEVIDKISSYPGREKSRLLKLAEYEIAKMPASKLTRQHFNAWRDVRRAETRIVKGQAKPISRKTIKDELSLMKRVLEYTEDEWALNLPKGNPIDVRRVMRRIENDKDERPAIQSQDIETKLLEACAEYGDGHSLRDFVELGLATGCRRGELVGLTWENVFIDEKIIKVRNKDRKRDGNKLRKAPLGKRAMAVLNRIGIQDHGPVFIYTNPDSVTKALARVRAKHPDIPDFEFITPHVLRHTAITREQKKGLTPSQVQAMSGHKTTQMLDNYTHVQAEDVVDLVD